MPDTVRDTRAGVARVDAAMAVVGGLEGVGRHGRVVSLVESGERPLPPNGGNGVPVPRCRPRSTDVTVPMLRRAGTFPHT